MGHLIVNAKIIPSTMPEIIAIPFGLGHKSYGHDDKQAGVNPYEIFESDKDLLIGTPSTISTMVSIEKLKIKTIT
jgi:hypothetical protein